jgi:hypothetical protein
VALVWLPRLQPPGISSAHAKSGCKYLQPLFACAERRAPKQNEKAFIFFSSGSHLRFL